MTEEELSARLRAVERALTDGEDVPDLADAADAAQRLDALEAEVAALAERVDALDATVQSLHGYVGELEHVNDRVERRADAARAAVERLEGRRTPPDASGARTEAGIAELDGDDESGRDNESHRNESRHDGSLRRSEETEYDDESLFGRVRDAL